MADEADIPEQTTEALPAGEPRKVYYTSKIKRGLALVRMITMSAFDDSAPPAATIVERWTKKQRTEFNAALEWLEQEEDWESVKDAWTKVKGT